MKPFRTLMLAAVLATGASVAFAQTQPVDRIAAVVNEDVILQSELDRAIANITTQYAANPGQLPPHDVLTRQVLERLVLTRLQIARAQESGIRVPDQELDQAISGIAQQNGFSVPQLQAKLAQDGMTMPDFRSSIRDEIIIQRLKQSYAQSRIQVSEAEIDALITQQAAAGGGVQYRLANILVALPEGATPEQIEVGQKKVDGIKDLIDRKEMEFSAAAVRYSNSPNALEGGDLGWRPASEIPPAFAEIVRGMQPGQVVGPMRGVSGFQLVKLVEVREGGSAPHVTQYHVRRILVDGDDNAARAKLDTLRARIAGGADFAKLAREESTDASSKDKGGDLGWLPADALGAEIAAQLPALSDGQVTTPVKTDAGWQIVQVNGKRETVAGSEEQRAAARETIGRRKLEDEYNRFLQEMRGDAYVDIRSGTTPAPTTTGG